MVFMDELPETIGSMPSVPQQEPRPPAPQPRPKSANQSVAIGFFLCAVCLFVFPTYAHMDDLGTGTFYGMGSMILLLAILSLFGTVTKRPGKNRPPKAFAARAGAEKSSRLRRINSILFGVVILLLGVFLMTSANVANMEDLSFVGLIVLLLGVAVTFASIINYSRANRRLAAAQAGQGTVTEEQRQRSNRIQSGFVLLFLGVCSLAFPRVMGVNAFGTGIIYGIGLVYLFMAMLVLGNAIASFISRKTA